MITIKSHFELDGQNTEELLDVLENLARDLNNIQNRQERLAEVGVEMSLQLKDGEPVVQLQDTS